MPGSLAEIVQNKKLELIERIKKRPLDEFESKVRSTNFGFGTSLLQPGVNLICELKPKSPSAGVLRSDVNIDEIISSYKRYARAISVLTDEKYFGGSVELLARVSRKSSLPTLCKDFILVPYQCYEAREAGAKAVLLIVKILDDNQLNMLHECAESLGMNAVVEVQTEDEIKRALRVNPRIILINNRNLDTFKTDLRTTERLAQLIPSDTILISASGISSKKHIKRLLPFCSNFLVGSALMKSDNMNLLLAELLNVDGAKVDAV